MLRKILKKASKGILSDRQALADLLRTDKDALAAFEKAYKNAVLDVSARQTSNKKPESAAIKAIISRIALSLLRQVEVTEYSNEGIHVRPKFQRIGDDTPISPEEIYALPKELRPQLTSTMAVRDTDVPGYALVAMYYYQAFSPDSSIFPAERRQAYCRMRQGIDILDIDPIIYEALGHNLNSMSKWLPQLVGAIRGSNSSLKIPRTKIMKVPPTVMQMTRIDYGSLTDTTKQVINKLCYEAFELSDGGNYFVKTGTYSDKFDFRNCHVVGNKNIKELGEYLLYIQNKASLMAGSFPGPAIYGVSTTNEWVVRDYIPDGENLPTIYSGLPLRTEFRVFIDCDKKAILGISPYWREDIMKDRFERQSDKNSPEMIHDSATFRAALPRLISEYDTYKPTVISEIEKILPSLSLEGQYSLDIMLSEDDLYAIDMAVASSSALSDCVPNSLLRRIEELPMPAPAIR